MMTKKKLIPAVMYIRMSSGKQEASPDQQREHNRKLADDFGYEIVSEYFDRAKSGMTSKRKDFQRMISDLDSGKFKIIVVWDQDRFGRFDPVEANHYWFLLREAGVKIHAVVQGIIDTEDLGDWLKASVVQHGKRQTSIDIGRTSLRGHLARAEGGSFIKSVPIGLCRVFLNSSGK